jgi:hypothetical protein
VARRAGRDGKVRKTPLKISVTLYEKLKRVQAVMKNAPNDLEAVLERLADEYLDREDPVKKAERAFARQAKRKPGRAETSASPAKPPQETKESRSERSEFRGRRKPLSARSEFRGRRKPLTAHETHAVNLRDGGRCTFVDQYGNRCPNERYLHVHHVRPVSLGGTNDPGNLTTLCSAHHDLVHQLSFGIDGQVNWIKAPTRSYH